MTTRHSTSRRPALALALFCSMALAAAAGPARSAGVTAAECKAGHDELIASIEAAREQAVAQLSLQIADAEDQQRIIALTALRERAWDDEESQRNRAQQIYYDCLKATR
jgi:hypothetical protein